MKEIRLVIGIPSTGLWQAEFGMCLVFLTNYLASHHVINGKVIQFRVHNKRGSTLASMRQNMLSEAIKHQATHFLFIDSDQTFPADTVHRLMAHKKQVVAANVATKQIPSYPTARLKGDTFSGIPVYTGPNDKGLVEVWRVGTGIMLIDLNVFKREGLKEGPWFDQVWNPEINDYAGEDWGFCEALKKAGVRLYIDQELSYEVGHIGNLTYNHDLCIDDGGMKRASGDS